MIVVNRVSLLGILGRHGVAALAHALAIGPTLDGGDAGLSRGSRGDPHPKAQGPCGQTVFQVHCDLLFVDACVGEGDERSSVSRKRGFSNGCGTQDGKTWRGRPSSSLLRVATHRNEVREKAKRETEEGLKLKVRLDATDNRGA
jgi:hypothetical protein